MDQFFKFAVNEEIGGEFSIVGTYMRPRHIVVWGHCLCLLDYGSQTHQCVEYFDKSYVDYHRPNE